MVGKGKIGANACIGSATTVFNYSVEPGQVVPPGFDFRRHQSANCSNKAAGTIHE